MKLGLLLGLLFFCVPAHAEIAAAPPSPLLVVLHGDSGVTASELQAAWARFAGPRNVAVLSLTCPVSEGCKGSWWRWNGDPAWIAREVDRFAEKHPIDRERLWIAGWSGGASYIGMRAQELGRLFTGIVIHGGGVAPSRSECGPKRPVVMLLGDKNPLHGLARELRDYYATCGHPMNVMLLPGADHAAEWKALDARGGTILDALRYRTGAIRPILDPGEDPGRERDEAFFDATYGSSAKDVEAALVPVTVNGQVLRVHRKIEAPFRRVAARLTEAIRAEPSLGPKLTSFGGTFNWRPIAGTTRRSAHAWGIAIDLDPVTSDYWRNDSLEKPTWRNRLPQAIVDAFEAEGFIWGGRWYHYDTMHFEYRPELLFR
jgi:predicted esterase